MAWQIFMLYVCLIYQSWKHLCTELGARGSAVGATSRKVAGSIPDGVIGIFHPSGRTVAVGSTQPLTDMGTKNISWV
jgi:hypothetical protein